MIEYYNNIISNNISYSIDMIRLRLDFGLLDRISDFANWCMRIDNLHIEEFPLSTKAFSYRYLFKIRCDNCHSFVCGLGFNGTDSDSSVLGFLEFNPNKVATEKKFIDFFETLQEHCPRTDLVRWDLAVDVPISREYCSLVKDKRKYCTVRNSIKDCTEYLGKRSSPGFVKLYNKSLETNLETDITRLEITVDGKMNYSDFCTLIPLVDIADYQLSFSEKVSALSSTDSLIVDLIRKLPLSERQFYFKRLNTYKQVKLRPYIYPQTELKNIFVITSDIFARLKKLACKFDFGTLYTTLDDASNYL